jgi:hypothetical protein
VVDGGTLLGYGRLGGIVVDLVEQTYCMVKAVGTTFAAGASTPLPTTGWVPKTPSA